MADERTVYYATTKDVSNIYKPGYYQSPVILSSDSGSSQVSKNRINITLVNLQTFTPGDYVRVFDNANPIGETIQIQSVVTTGPYLETISNMTKNFTTAQSAKVELQSAFNSEATGSIEGGLPKVARTKPSAQVVNALINQAEAKIETATRQAWRAVTVTEDYNYPLRTYRTDDWLDGIDVKLLHRGIRTVNAAGDGSPIFDTASGDKILIYNGSSWQDWLTAFSGGHNAKYWVDAIKGYVYLRGFFKLYRKNAIRLTYRYGWTTTPADITRCAALIVAAQLAESDDYVVGIPGGGDLNIVPVGEKAKRWRDEAEQIMKRYREPMTAI